MMKYFFLLSLIVTITAKGYTQSLGNSLRALQAKRVGKMIKKKGQYGISKATYLGSILDSTNKIKYWIVEEFYTVQAAVIPHGHSRILFFDERKKLIAEVVVDMPEELPIKIYKNNLLFHYSEGGIQKKFSFQMDNKPKELCVEPTSCYSVDYK
jgi:hypothetical protein